MADAVDDGDKQIPREHRDRIDALARWLWGNERAASARDVKVENERCAKVIEQRALRDGKHDLVIAGLMVQAAAELRRTCPRN